MFVDSHAHIDMDVFDSDRDKVVKNAFAAGVDCILNVGYDLDSSKRSVELSLKYDGIYAAVGVHPHDARLYTDAVESELVALLAESKVIAVGETGLDFHYDNSPRDIQKDVFIRQLNLGCKYNLPVIIHCRDAMDDILKILSDIRELPKGVFHCFSGNAEAAEKLLGMGFLLSFGGPVTFKNNKTAVPLFETLQVERILLETDSPYLSPVPFRGKRNEPALIPHIAKKIADIKGLSLEDVARITTLNFNRLFGLGSPSEVTIAYPIRNALYLNITNRCTNACSFCARETSYTVKGHHLKLDTEPSVEDILASVDSFSSASFDEIVFCGFGEPLMRLDCVLEVASVLKAKGYKIRINTNGHASLIAGENAVEKLKGLIDAVSISLNASTSEEYLKLCRPRTGLKTFDAVIDFIRECGKSIPDVTATVVDMPGVDVEECRKIAEDLGVKFRVRFLNRVG